MSEKPVHSRPRRLVDWINLTGTKKVHSLIDKVYKRKNLEMAWEKVKANRGSGGVDGQNLEAFEAQLDQQLDRLQRELKEDTYQPLPVRQHPIPKRDKPGEYRMLGIPAIYDRVRQQALGIWSHRYKRWRTCGWKQLPETTLYGEYGLVNLVGLIPSLAPQKA
jgi:RNA-directed DNA polymerase